MLERVTVRARRRLNGTVTDGYESAAAYSTPEPIKECLVAPGVSEEDTAEANRSPISVEFTVYAPAGTALSERDQIEIPSEPGKWFDIAGRPKDWGAGVVILIGRQEG